MFVFKILIENFLVGYFLVEILPLHQEGGLYFWQTRHIQYWSQVSSGSGDGSERVCCKTSSSVSASRHSSLSPRTQEFVKRQTTVHFSQAMCLLKHSSAEGKLAPSDWVGSGVNKQDLLQLRNCDRDLASYNKSSPSPPGMDSATGGVSLTDIPSVKKHFSIRINVFF